MAPAISDGVQDAVNVVGSGTPGMLEQRRCRRGGREVRKHDPHVTQRDTASVQPGKQIQNRLQQYIIIVGRLGQRPGSIPHPSRQPKENSAPAAMRRADACVGQSVPGMAPVFPLFYPLRFTCSWCLLPLPAVADSVWITARSPPQFGGEPAWVSLLAVSLQEKQLRARRRARARWKHLSYRSDWL